MKVAGFVAGAAIAAATTVAASGGFTLDAIEGDWYHKKSWITSFDHRSIRRGYEVYRQICSTCHSMNYLHFRNLIGVSHTEAQAKMIAQSYTVVDGPNSEGENFERPGKLFDQFPAPYPNEETARLANNGAYPPDLSCIVKARHGAEDYIYSLLTGYRQPPAGVTLRPGLHYNPYFPDGAIAMASPLQHEGIEYEDGTHASVPQQAKDVTTFLAWASDPETNARKLQIGKFVIGLFAASASLYWWKTHRWSILKARKISWTR